MAVGRSIHVPDEWARRERERRLALTIPSVVGFVVLALIVVAAGLASLVAWSAGRFHAGSAVVAWVAVSSAGLADAWNSWPAALAGFSTARSIAGCTTYRLSSFASSQDSTRLPRGCARTGL